MSKNFKPKTAAKKPTFKEYSKKKLSVVLTVSFVALALICTVLVESLGSFIDNSSSSSSTVSPSAATYLEFEDEAVQKFIAAKCGVTEGDKVPADVATTITTLYFTGVDEIKSCKGIEQLTALCKITFSGVKNLGDISALADAPSLNEIVFINTSFDNVTADKKLSNVRTLSFDDKDPTTKVTSLFDGVKTLTVDTCDIENFEALKPLTSVEKLTVYSCELLKDFTGLENATALKTLTISSCYTESLTGINSIPNLETFSLKYSNITDMSAIKNNTTIKYLDCTSAHTGGAVDIFTTITGLKSLTLTNFNSSSNPVDLANIENLTELETLSFSNAANFDFNDLAGLTKLENLTASNSGITDISAITNLTNLKTLTLDYNKITDFAPLGSLTKLTALSLIDVGLDNVDFLATLRKLVSLYITNNSGVTDITEVGGLWSLTTFGANGCSIDTMSLAECTKLSYLNLGNNKITNVDDLSALTALTTLELNNNDIEDITSVGSLTALTNLNVSNNKIVSISPITTCTKLTTLSAFANKIENITSLSTLTALTSLDLHDNQITDITAIGKMTKLTTLKLNNNKITDISALSTCTKLSSINIATNNITDYSVLEVLGIAESNITK